MLTATYKRYALAAITTVYAVNHFDRGLMFLLLQPIKQDLQLSDTQLGFLTGIGFGLFYTVLGVPFARWADRGNRVTITALAMALWGLTAVAFPLITSYAQLLCARVAAGVGDAGVQPPMYSLLGDYFPTPAERTRAMYIWSMAAPIAAFTSFMGGGWLNDQYGWRLSFFFTGIVGLLLAALVRWTLAEPRLTIASTRSSVPPQPPLTQVLSILWQGRSCRNLAFAFVLLLTVGHGAVSWQSAFLMRHHGMSTTELGVWMGLISGVGGLGSLLLGQYVVGRWFADNERGQMLLAAAGTVCCAPIFIAFLALPTKEQALAALLIKMLVFGSFQIAPFVLLQRLVPDTMRATTLMVVLLFANLIGYGVGPLVVGVISDTLRPHYGDANALRYAMMMMSVGWVLAAYHFYMVARSIGEDLRNATLSRRPDAEYATSRTNAVGT